MPLRMRMDPIHNDATEIRNQPFPPDISGMGGFVLHCVLPSSLQLLQRRATGNAVRNEGRVRLVDVPLALFVADFVPRLLGVFDVVETALSSWRQNLLFLIPLRLLVLGEIIPPLAQLMVRS